MKSRKKNSNTLFKKKIKLQLVIFFLFLEIMITRNDRMRWKDEVYEVCGDQKFNLRT